MSNQTTMQGSAPTEAEIRAAIEASAMNYRAAAKNKLEEAISDYVDDLRWQAGDLDLVDTDPAHEERGISFWRDLRPSEDDRLRTLLYEAEQRAVASCHELIVSEYFIAIRTFAVEHPDAPRAVAKA